MDMKEETPWGNFGDFPDITLDPEQLAVADYHLQKTRPLPPETRGVPFVVRTQSSPSAEEVAQKELHNEAMALLLEKLIAARQAGDLQKIAYYESEVAILDAKTK